MKSKAINKYFAKVVLLAINESQKSKKYLFQINYMEDSYSLYVFEKQDNEVVYSSLSNSLNFKNLRNTKRKILKMMEEK